MRQCTLPSDFTTWDESDDLEEEAFTRFREQSALEVLSHCLQLLHTEFVTGLRNQLGGGSATWQQLESAFFVIRGLHVDLKATLSAEFDGVALPPALLQEHKQLVQSLLSEIFSQLATWKLASQPTPLVVSVVRLCGSFGKWLQAEPELLQGCLRLALQAMAVPEATEHASEAFRLLCVHGKRHLANSATIFQLLNVCKPSLSSQTVSGEHRIALSEGVARLIGAVRSADDARQALQAAVEDPCKALHALLQQIQAPATVPPSLGAASSAHELSQQIALQIQLITSSIRFCDNFKPDNHPVPPILHNCWALLQESARRCGTPQVIQALCELYTKAMCALRALMAPLLPSLLQQLKESFCATPVVGCLTCITQALEMYGEEDDEVRYAISEVVEQVIDTVCSWLHTTAEPESEPELLTSFFEMCHRCLVFRPGIMLNLASVPMLFDTAISCVSHQEFQHTRAALTFLCLFMSGTDAATSFRESAAHCMQQSGAQLVQRCLAGIASTAPANLVDHLVELMRVLAEACPGAVQNWMVETFKAPAFSCGALQPQGPAVATFVQLIVKQPALSTGDFQSVVSDFSRMCRGKLSPDSLDRYPL